MRAQAAIAAALLAAVAVAPAADAAPKKKKPKPVPPACNLVNDPTGDVSNRASADVPVDVFQPDPSLDLVGADVATDAKRITAVVRLAAEPGTATAYAKRYIVQMNVVGLKNPLVLAGAITPTGNSFSMGYYGVGATGTTGFNYPGDAVGRIDAKGITVSALLADVAGIEELGAVKPKAKISNITVTANRRVPSLTQVSGRVIVADEAIGKVPYFAGGRSCISQFAG